MLRAVLAMAALSIGSFAIAQDEEKGPPLPFITIEGAGGGAITQMAYLVNPAKEGEVFGKPSVAIDYIGLGSKSLDTLMVTENLWGRIELGFAADRLSLGNLPGAIQSATGQDIGLSDVWLYNFTVRGLVVKENSYDTEWLPAITVGTTFKDNEGIADINQRLNGTLTNALGYARKSGVDFTLTATKTLPTAFFGAPLIVSAGLRESQAANLGFLGFVDDYATSFETNVATFLSEKWLVAYEFRQHSNPFSGEIPGLVGTENNWHAFDVGYLINKHTTVVAGAGLFGNLANSEANNAWWVQLKHEF
jgi:hypothetical protein